MAFMAIIRGLRLVFHILLGFRYLLKGDSILPHDFGSVRHDLDSRHHRLIATPQALSGGFTVQGLGYPRAPVT